MKEACRQIIAEEERVQAERLEAKLKREDTTKSEATQSYNKFIGGGKLITTLSAKDVKLILKFLLPKLAPGEKMADYNNRQKALARLEKFGADSNGAITWEKEMDKHAPMVDSS